MTPTQTALEDGQGRLWVLDGEKLSYKELNGSTFQRFSHPLTGPGGQIRNMAPDGQGGLWVATAAGLMNIRGNEWRLPSSENGLPIRSADAVLVDRSGGLWFAGGGLYRELGLGLVTNYGLKEGLPSEYSWAIAQDPKGRIWIGTDRGLAVLEGGRWRPVPGTEGMSVASLVIEPDGTVLASGTYRLDLIRVDPKTGRATLHPLPGVDRGKVLSVRILGRRDGSLWAVAGPELLRLGWRQGRLEIEARFPSGREQNLGAAAALEDGQGTVWIAGSTGLSAFSNGHWTHFGEAQGLPNQNLGGMALAPDGSLYVSFRESLGVAQLGIEPTGIRVIRHLREEQGDLPTDSVFSVHFDRSGRLWLNTNLGAVLKTSGGYRLFGRPAGLLNPDMMQGAFHDDGRGALWFGTSSGMVRLETSGAGWDPQVPEAVFSSLAFGRRQLDPAALPATLKLPPRENTLECSLGCLSFSQEKNYSYEVRLDGLEREWRTEPLPHVRYAALPPGDYRLRVRIRSNGHTGPERQLTFTVLPRWYQTWTFRSLLVIALGPMLWGIAAWRHRRLRVLNEKLEALVHSRTLQLEEANRLLEDQSLHDPLTGLHNRRFLTLTLPEQVARIQRELETRKVTEVLGGHPLAFLLVDVDHFKHVNDECGHAAGDQVLVELSRRLREVVRETDTVIRWGGEEFLVVARQLGASDLSTLAERLRRSVEEAPFRLEDGLELPLTISLGFCPFPLGRSLPMLAWDKAVMLADRALYAAKRSGRNRWVGLDEGPAFDPVELAAFAGHPDIPGLLDRKLLLGVGSHDEPPLEVWR